MPRSSHMKKHIRILSFVSLVLLAVPLFSTAQQAEPTFFVTWRAQSYVPAGFNGKILPAANSPITASFELVQNGKLVNLSRETILWYLDRKLIQSGVGLQTISFLASDAPGTQHELRARINNFQDKSIIVLKTVRIPVAQSEAVIRAPFYQNAFSGGNARVTALPYFFNVQNQSELDFSWEVSGQRPVPGGSPEILDVNSGNLVPGQILDIRLDVSKPGSLFETATKIITLMFQ